MTKPKTSLQLLEYGIAHREWASVIDGFELMAGFRPAEIASDVENDFRNERLKELTCQLFELVVGSVPTSLEEESAPKRSTKAVEKKVISTRKKVVTTPPSELEDETDEELDGDDEPTEESPRRTLPPGANRFASQESEESKSGGTLRCRTRAFQKPKGPNQFTDSPSLNPQLIKETKRLSKKASPKAYRPPPQLVLKRCAGCRTKERVPPEALMSDGSYRCNDCARGGVAR